MGTKYLSIVSPKTLQSLTAYDPAYYETTVAKTREMADLLSWDARKQQMPLNAREQKSALKQAQQTPDAGYNTLGFTAFNRRAADGTTVVLYNFADIDETTRINLAQCTDDTDPYSEMYTGAVAPWPGLKADVTQSMQQWSDVARIRFIEDPEHKGEMKIHACATSSVLSGYAQPYDGVLDPDSMSGDIVLTAPRPPLTLNARERAVAIAYNNDYNTTLHEIGHVMGLRHWQKDATSKTTIMSYIPDPGHQMVSKITRTEAEQLIMAPDGTCDPEQEKLLPLVFSKAETYWPLTPMPADILAGQNIYLPNMKTRTGDTVYGFNTNSDMPDVHGLTGPEDRKVFCIWDAGGHDRLDLSGSTRNEVIDIRPGAYSSANGLHDNIAIALGVTIEDAFGGVTDDRIIGNDSNNWLRGGGGDDRLRGGKGNDRLDGSDGFDWAELSGTPDQYTFKHNTDDTWTVRDKKKHRDGTDTLIAINGVIFGDGSHRVLDRIDAPPSAPRS